MNRPIKFRARRLDTGDWVYGHYFSSPITDENSGTPPEAGWFFLSGTVRHCIEQDHVAYVIDPETLGQFTGLTDKNGKEIYEGDVCIEEGDTDQYGNQNTREVFFEDCSFWLGNRREDGSGCIFMRVSDHSRTMEIIGNIYENPELLNV